MLSPPYKRSRSLRGTAKMVSKASAAIIKPDTLRGLRARVTATAVGIDPVERHLGQAGTVHTVDDFESGGQVGLVGGLRQVGDFRAHPSPPFPNARMDISRCTSSSAEAAEIKAREDLLKAELTTRGVREAESDLFRATVTVTSRWTLNAE
jgi:hypothetical protein